MTNTNESTILGMDVSSKTIGCSLFTQSGQLVEMKYLTPKIEKDEDPFDNLLEKSNQFKNFIKISVKEHPASWGQIKTVLIEEPLLSANNLWTVGSLIRYNGMISQIIYDVLKIKPKYISTYESRKNAFPELVQPNKHGKKVLFGGLPKDIDKKMIIWNLVSEREPQIIWPTNKKNILIKECFDLSDSYCVVLGYMNKNKLW